MAQAPDWYRSFKSPFLGNVPPPPLPGTQDAGPAGPGAEKPLPKLPTLPKMAGGANLPVAPPRMAPPQRPGQSMLPPPPAPPKPASTELAVAKAATKAAVQSGPSALVRAAPQKKDEEIAFVIPGLQDRPFTDEEVEVAWQMMDIDAKGYLSRQDLRRVIDLVGDGDVRDTELDEMIRLACRDDIGGGGGDEGTAGGTNKVSPEEFKQLFQDPPLLFRNFDLHRRAGIASDVADNRARSVYSGIASTQASKEAIMDDPRQEGIEKLAAICCGGPKVGPDFVRQVYHSFVEFDIDNRGYVDFDAFCLACMPDNRHPERNSSEERSMREAFDSFDTDHIGEVDLRRLIVGMAVFSDSPLPMRLRFAFLMYDEDRKASLGRRDLSELLRAMSPFVPEFVRERHIQRLYQLNELHENERVGEEMFVSYVLQNLGALLRHEMSRTQSRGGSKVVAIRSPHAEDSLSRRTSNETRSRMGSYSQLQSRQGTNTFGASSTSGQTRMDSMISDAPPRPNRRQHDEDSSDSSSVATLPGKAANVTGSGGRGFLEVPRQR